MVLPIKFPSNVDVISEEVAHFRALSPENQIRALGDTFGLYRFLETSSPHPEALARAAQEDKERERKAIEEFVARHV
jgi:hypothetical protein